MPASSTGHSATILNRILLVFVPFAAGYFLSYLFRNINAVIVPELVSDLALSATDLGFLTAAYFLGFTAFQLPLGVLLDRYGPRRVQAVLLSVAGIGAVIFGVGDTPLTLVIGRTLIGLGVSGCLMGSFKAIVQWFPAERWALTNGLLMAIGGVGAMSATSPIRALVAASDWRTVFIGLGILTWVVAIVILTVVPRRSDRAPAEQQEKTLAGLAVIYRDRLFWRIAPISVTAFGASMAMFSLWMGPWLRDVPRLDRAGVDTHLFVMAAALTLGFVLIGLVSDFFSRRGVPLIKVMIAGQCLFVLAQIPIFLGYGEATFVVVFLFGLLGNSGSLVYAILSHHFPQTHSARANTGLNLLVFATVFVVQWLMGVIIDLWPVTAGGGYETVSYTAATGTILGLQVVSLIWFFASGRRA